MAPHIIDAEVIQLPIPSHGVKSYLGANDGGMLWSVPDFEHALTGIAENRSRTWIRSSLDILKQRLERVIYHFPCMVL